MNAPTEMTVRRARIEDVSALARLRYEFRVRRANAVEAEADFIPRCTEWMRARLPDENRWRAWVLAAGGELVGAIWLEIIDKLPNPGVELERHAYVTSFFVRPEYRRQGEGSRMLAAVLEQCAALDVDTIFLWPSEESRPLYARHGFSPAANNILILKR